MNAEARRQAAAARTRRAGTPARRAEGRASRSEAAATGRCISDTQTRSKRPPKTSCKAAASPTTETRGEAAFSKSSRS